MLGGYTLSSLLKIRLDQIVTLSRDIIGLDNTTYNLISALEREADFLYSTVETYINDASKEAVHKRKRYGKQ